jgi:HlyD family secretion protein
MKSMTALTLATLALLGGCDRGRELPLPGTLARERIEHAAQSAEPVVEWKVAEGQRVVAGTVLLILDPARAQAAVDRATAARDRALRRVDELVRGPRRETIDELQARYDGAKLQLATDEREFARQVDLAKKNLGTQAAADIQRSARDRAITALHAARAQLAAALQGTTLEELDQARAALAEAQALLTDAEVALARLTVVASADGVVDALPFKPGERPQLGQAVAVVLGDARVYARVYVPEPLRARVTVGTPAVISVDGLAKPFKGEVRYVASDAAYTPYYSLTEHDRSRLAFRAEIDLVMDADAAKLPSGVPVFVDFPSLHE